MRAFGDDDEEDDEWGFTYKSGRDRSASSPPPVVQPAVQTESATATAKPSAVVQGLKSDRTQEQAVAVRLCKAQSAVRYPKDHPDESLRGQPVLDADGARRYRPCRKPPMQGQEVCDRHGGRAPQAQQAAKLRLLQATEPLIAELIAIALDTRLPAADRTRAINSALDRAGVRAGMDVNVETPRFVQMLGRMFGHDDASSTQDGPDRTIIEAEVVGASTTDEEQEEYLATLQAALQRERFEALPNYVNSDDTPPERFGVRQTTRQRK